MAENASRWPYLLLAVGEDKKTSRSGVEKGFAYEVVGVDGNSESGLRPLSGFKQIHELSFLPATNHDLTSRLLDFYPVQFSIGSNGYAYGFVYRVLRSVGSGAVLADIFLDYWNSRLGTWSTGNLVVESVEPDAPWSRVAWGRFVYVLVRGRGAAMFYIDPDNQALTKLGDDVLGPFPGPGKQPLLTSPEKASQLGSFDGVPATERPGSGQIVLVTVLPSESFMYPGPNGGYNSESTSTSGSGSVHDCTVELTDDNARELEYGDYTFCYQLVDSRTGRKSALSQIAQARTEDFTALSSSGSDSGSSDDTYAPTNKYAVLELVYDSDKYDQAYIYRSVKVQDAGGTLIGAIPFLDRIIDLECLWTARNNPGYTFDPAVTTLRHVTYWYELEDKQLCYQETYPEKPLFDEVVPKAGAAIMYENTLICANIGTPATSTDEANRSGDTLRGLGEIRWSSLSDSQPELFAPSSRYVPSVPSIDILRFQPAGSNIMGFSSGRLFFMRKDSTAIRVVETHQGYGICGQHAADTIGSTIWYGTFKGVKTLDASTQLDDIRGLNHLIMNEWDPVDLSRLCIVFDPSPSSLFVYNPAVGKAAVIWMNTSRITEIHDLPFLQVQRGVWPVDHEDAASDLEERALWVQDFPRNGTEAAPAGWKPRVFLLDNTRSKVIAGTSPDAGDPRLTLLDVEGETRFDVGATFSSGEQLTFIADGTHALDSGYEGAWVYVVSSATSSLVGKKAQIQTLDTTDPYNPVLTLTTATAADLHGLATDDRIVISPVLVRWVGHPVATQTEDGVDFGGQDFFRVKRLDSVGCSFANVDGAAAGTEDAKFFSLAFRGDEADAAARSVPRDPTTGSEITSVVEGGSVYFAAFGQDGAKNTTLTGKFGVEGQSMCPGVEILCPDLDYNLMACMVTGSVRSAIRTQRG